MQLKIAHKKGVLGTSQARALGAQLKRLIQGVEISLVPVEPDVHSSRGEVFTTPLEDALLVGDADIGVASLHDLRGLLPEGLKLAAVTQRVDARDAVVTSNGLPVRVMNQGTRVLVDCLRRANQLARIRADLVPVLRYSEPEELLAAVRGGEFDAAVVALSDLRWMGMEQSAAEILALDEVLSGAGQGALGLIVREEKDSLAERSCLVVHHKPTWLCVRAERAVISALGAWSDAPIGVLAELTPEGAIKLRAAAFVSGEPVAQAEGSDSPERATELAQQVAGELLRAGADKVLREARAGAIGRP